MMATEIRGELSDGSAYVVENTDWKTRIVSRYVNGECVWGQVFSSTEDVEAIAERVVNNMRDNPANYIRWWNVKGDK